MAQRSGVSRLTIALLGCFGLVFAGSVVCCGGSTVGLWLVYEYAPNWLLDLFTEGQPLTAPPPAPSDPNATQAKIDAGKADPTQTVHLTGDELVNLVWTDHTTVPVLALEVDPQNRVTFDVSVVADPGRYVNVHARLPTVVIEHGWFKSLTCDQLTVSGWDLGSYVGGQDLAMNVNQQLAQNRRTDPNLDAALNSLAEFTAANGGFDVQFEGKAPTP